jgi:hypothetical protein
MIKTNKTCLLARTVKLDTGRDKKSVQKQNRMTGGDSRVGWSLVVKHCPRRDGGRARRHT